MNNFIPFLIGKLLTIPSTSAVASSEASMHQTAHMPAKRLENNFTGSPVNHLPPLAPPVEVVSLSTVAPDIIPVRPGFSPMVQQRSANMHNGFELRAPAPHLRATIPAPYNSVHRVPNPCSGISNQQLPLR